MLLLSEKMISEISYIGFGTETVLNANSFSLVYEKLVRHERKVYINSNSKE